MNVTVICLGKLKEQYLKDACDEYLKRLGAFCRCKVVELSPVKLPDNPSAAQITAALNREAAMIREKIPKGAAVFALCIEGRTLTSEQFSERLQAAAVQGGADVTFLIGSSFGLDEELKKAAQFRLSMSPMTFPHQLARVMLLEQIYRAFQIASGGKYHK